MVKHEIKCFAAALLGSAQAFHVPRAAHTAPLVRPVEATAIADYLPDVPAEFMAQASITADEVAARYEKSVSDPGAFWAEEASRYHWETPFDASNVFSANFKRSEGEIYAKWFEGGTTNLCYNALDRQVAAGLGDKVCFIAERNDEGEAAPQPATYTYGEALDRAAKGPSSPRTACARGKKVVDLWSIVVDALAIAEADGQDVAGGSIVLRRLDDDAYPAPALAANQAWWHDALAAADPEQGGVIFEGVPSWPDAGRLWRVVDDHKVTHVYTAPTAIRALMRSGDDPVKATSRKSLKVLGSVGEPINPEAWKWYREVVGEDRVDDVVVASGHNIGTAEVESALVAHPAVAEAAIVGIPNDLKGNSLYAFLKLRAKSDVAAFAAPDAIHWAPGLPKTRSGKIMRRILRKIAAGGVEVDREGLGDTSTLADPSIVDDLINSHATAAA
ncbi:acyl-CoA synthetase [Aureococcus anophagefferens]|uniref:acetate--CoA ligase n=1 Tax=Aureococcus anophagefferens TaxID=44056 RepID=A0ABR1G076_AURAN